MEMMNHKKMVKQMVDLQKTLFDSTFNAVTVARSYTDKMMDLFWSQVSWSSEKCQEMAGDWTKACREGCEMYRKSMESNFAKVESLVINE
jgi:hypothetical protein